RSEAEGIPPRSEAEGIPPRSEAEGIPPRSEAEGIPPRSEAEGIPPRSEAEGIQEDRMQPGMQIGYSGAAVADSVKAAELADELNFHSIWTAEAYGSDAITPLVWMGAHTSKVKLATGIMQMPARSPAMTAMTAATLDALSGGRFICGLGLSGPQVVE